MSAQGVYSYWGKAAEDSGYHLLPYHCLDVAAVARNWLTHSRSLNRALAVEVRCSESQAAAWALFFIALHDFGKFDVRFQLKAPGVAHFLWEEFKNAKVTGGYSHGDSGHGWFVKEFESLGFPPEIFDPASEWMQAVAGHHGALPWSPEISTPFAASHVKRHASEARQSFVASLAALFLEPEGLSFQDVPKNVPQMLAGFCSICDWVGSNTNYFPYQSSAVPLDQYFRERIPAARTALVASGLISRSRHESGMAALFPTFQKLEGIQELVDEWQVEPGLTLIEAPTGSGKTEAALAFASRLLAAGLAESIVFALPTQATANAMLSRLEAVASRMFHDSPNLVLAHGKSRFNTDFVNLKQAAEGQTRQGQHEALAQCAHWLGSSRKRAFLGQIGVCTIDQVLLSVLPVRHYFVRSFGVRRSILIIDEIHAYDAYMYGLIDRVLKGQKEAGGSAILLSATLPGHMRQKLLDSWGCEGAAATVQHYPLVTQALPEGSRIWSLPENKAPKERQVKVRLWTAENLRPVAGHIQEIVTAAEDGGRVAVICNLVADAQWLAGELKTMATVPVDLFHSRFLFRHRQTREKEVLAQYSKDEQTGGRILVATQVVEQSLDLDFDWMITQVCPVDLLFQRLGRLHRHKRRRPTTFREPAVTVLVPENADYQLHEVIYANKRALWRTEQLLRSETSLSFPDAYRRWIEAVYDESPWPDEPQDITEAFQSFQDEELGAYYSALGKAMAQTVPMADTDSTAAALTRDSQMSLNVVLVQKVAGKVCLLDGRPLAGLEEWEKDEILNLNMLAVPDSWRQGLPSPDDHGIHYLPMEREGDSWIAHVNKIGYRYSEYFGFEKEKL